MGTRARLAGTLAAIAAACVAAGLAGLSFAFVHPAATPISPAAGLGVAALLLAGLRAWPAVAVAAFITNVITLNHIGVSAAIAAGNTLECLLAAALMMRVAHGRSAFDSGADVFRFMFSAIGASIVAAAIGVTAVRMGNLAAPVDTWRIWLTWWLGDATGIAIYTPFAVLLARRFHAARGSRRDCRARGGVGARALRHIRDGGRAAARFSSRGPAAAADALVGLSRRHPHDVRNGRRHVGSRRLSHLAAVRSLRARDSGTFAADRSVDRGDHFAAHAGGGRRDRRSPPCRIRAPASQRDTRATCRRSHRGAVARARTLRRCAGGGADRQLGVGRRVEHVVVVGRDVSDLRADDAPVGYEPYLTLIHPDDRERTEQDVQRAITTGRPFTFEHRILRPDGEHRLIHAQGRVQYDAAGAPRRLLGTGHDITERHRAEEARAQLIHEQAKLREAEAMNRAKDDFLATLSHELRTPLNAALGWMHILRDSMHASGRDERIVQAIYRNLLLQSRIVSDIMDISRIAKGELPLEREPVEMRAVFESAVDMVRDVGDRERRHRRYPQRRVSGRRGDSRRLQQVAWNLLSNSVKFCARGGEVSFRRVRMRSQRRVHGRGRRSRHCARFSAARLRAVPSGRLFDDSRAWRAGTRTRHRARDRGDARGEIVAANRTTGGAVFVVRLPKHAAAVASVSRRPGVAGTRMSAGNSRLQPASSSVRNPGSSGTLSRGSHSPGAEEQVCDCMASLSVRRMRSS